MLEDNAFPITDPNAGLLSALAKPPPADTNISPGLMFPLTLTGTLPISATVAAESGADERSIMAMTGHKTTQMVRRYIREANIFKNNALNKIKM